MSWLVNFLFQFVAKKLRGIPLSITDQYVFSTAPINIKKQLTIDLAVQVRGIRDFKIPGRLTSRTVEFREEDWADVDVLGGNFQR